MTKCVQTAMKGKFLQSIKRTLGYLIAATLLGGLCAHLVLKPGLLLEPLGRVSSSVAESLAPLVQLRRIDDLPVCSMTLHRRNGGHQQYAPNMTYLPLEDVSQRQPNVKFGGHYKPTYCKPTSRVAIIVPFRDRHKHLSIFLNNLHTLLVRQGRSYSIFVIHQVDDLPFNRGTLCNVGFLEAQRLNSFDCFISHDVDLIPKHASNLYECPQQFPLHLCSKAINPLASHPVSSLFGGVSAVPAGTFVAANGFSNNYWGWGGEDDDLFHKLESLGFQVLRRSKEIGTYLMIPHLQEQKNPQAEKMLQSWRIRMKYDSLNSTEYELLGKVQHRLYTEIRVELLIKWPI